MKKIYLLVLMVAVLFTACKKDDDTKKLSNKELIIGKWVFVSGVIDGEFREYPHQCSTQKDYIEIKEDGTANEYEYDKKCEMKIKKFTWKLTGENTLISQYNNKEPVNYEIQELTDKVLKYKYNDEYTGENGKKVTEEYIITLNKM